MRPNLITRLKEEWNNLDPVDPLRGLIADAIEALAEQPAQQQEPIAWIERDMQCDDFDPDSVTCQKPDIAADGWEWVPLYITTPRKPLTDEQIQYAFRTNSVMVDNGNAYMVAGKRAINITRAIEAAHGIKGDA